MSSDVIVSGPLIEPFQPAPSLRGTIVARRIKDFLVDDHKSYNQEVFDWMTTQYGKSAMRQLMTPRDRRVGHDSNTMYTNPCARKAWHQYHGSEGEPLQERQALKFLMGDGLEVAITGAARLAGVNLVDNNRDLFITGEDGAKVSVHPDGRIIEPGKEYNCEIKSADTFSFDDWLRNNGPTGVFGESYYVQASVEVAAWREAGYDINETILIAISTGSRQASIAEFVLPYDQSLVDKWHERRRLARAAERPPIPFQAEMETEFVKGKAIDADVAFAHGEPAPRLDKNGNVYGWDVATGRLVLPTTCSYCAYKGLCWPGAQLDVEGGKPKWIV